MSYQGDYYLISFNGVYLSGYAVVRADDETHALLVASREIPKELKCAKHFEVVKDFTFPKFGEASVIWNGDY